MGALRFRRAFVLCLVVAISVLFFLVIRRFALTVLLAAVFAGLVHPLHRWLQARVGRRLAGTTSVLLLVAVVGIPVAGFLTIVATQADEVSRGAEAWFREEGRLEQAQELVDRVPLLNRVFPDGDLVADQLREAATRTRSSSMGPSPLPGSAL